MSYSGKKKLVYIFPKQGNSTIKKRCLKWEKKYEYLDIVPIDYISSMYEDSELIVLYKTSEYDSFSFKEQSVIEAKKAFVFSEINRKIDDDCIINNERYDIIEKKLSEFNIQYELYINSIQL